MSKVKAKPESRYRSSTVVLYPTDMRLVEKLRAKLGVAATAAALRWALRYVVDKAVFDLDLVQEVADAEGRVTPNMADSRRAFPVKFAAADRRHREMIRKTLSLRSSCAAVRFAIRQAARMEGV